tara:strand:+ start:1844 stop:3235 length:1392 start_codon:yes stop_codon:yes gene_type:complete
VKVRKIRKEKRLVDSLRTIGFAVALLVILVLFLGIESFVSNVGSGIGDTITGDVIIIKGDIAEGNISNGNILCWLEGGLQEQDIIVAGNLLSDLNCPEGKKQEVIAKLEEGCVDVDIGGEAKAKLCGEDEKPDINLELVVGPRVKGSMFPLGFDAPVRNYAWYGLFLLIIVILFLLWREYEIRFVKTEAELRSERRYMKRKALKLKEEEERRKKVAEMKKKVKKIVRVPAAPLYDEKKARERERRKKEARRKLRKEKEKRKVSKESRRNDLALVFNKLSDSVNDAIIKGDVKRSRKNYLKLFEVYSNLVPISDRGDRNIMDSVMQYLFNYLEALEKVKSGKRYGMEQKARKTGAEIKAKSKIKSMEELEKVKELLKKRDYYQARNIFYGGKIERLDLKSAAENVSVSKGKDKLKEIELRHERLLKRGIINIDKDDYHNFMSDMTKLRKSLKKKPIKSKHKKKG